MPASDAARSEPGHPDEPGTKPRLRGAIREVNGPILIADLPGISIGEQVRVGDLGLSGEVIALSGSQAIIQAYESTDGVRPGELAEGLGYPLSVELGPGLIGQIFDGVQRPLTRIFESSGDHMPRGVQIPALDRSKRWRFEPSEGLGTGSTVEGGLALGSVQETPLVLHRILVPPGLGGELVELAPAGEYSLEESIGRVKDEAGRVHRLRLFHRWPVRRPRPYRQRVRLVEPLITGQRILDTFFPLMKGGKAAVPGPFGAGKTVVQQQVARWANADIVIYVGCGERGNELVDILETFPKLKDPYSGRPLMDRTLLVANTSNMPVVAREASIYVGITLAEYFRDMGYDVVMLADSTSRWAEALREVGGRLGQMPVEEGYPAYLASRLAAFYERAGRVETACCGEGSVSLIGAVSPPGGDFSEPVTSHTKEIIQTFWGLSKELADARHYPAIDWVASFSEHVPDAARWWAANVSPHWESRRAQALNLLARDAEALTHRQPGRPRGALLDPALGARGRGADQGGGAAAERAGAERQLRLPGQAVRPPRLGPGHLRQGRRAGRAGVPVQELAALDLLSRARRLKQTFSSDQVERIHEVREQIAPIFDQLRIGYAAAQESTAP